MENKLFLVCPFSCVENFIRKKYGTNSFFITSMAAQSQFHDIKYLETIKETMTTENIRRLFIVNDISCRFINRFLKGERILDTPAEKNIQNIFIDNYSTIMRQPSLTEKAQVLAALNIRQQAHEILENELFKSHMLRNKIVVKGLITTKSKDKIVEINLFTDDLSIVN